MNCDLADPEGLMNQLRILKSVNVDGVMVDCWWGIVEAHAAQAYNWSGYKRLFHIVRDLNLKLQVSNPFECGFFLRFSLTSVLLLFMLFTMCLLRFVIDLIHYSFISTKLRLLCHSMNAEVMLEMMCIFPSLNGSQKSVKAIPTFISLTEKEGKILNVSHGALIKKEF